MLGEELSNLRPGLPYGNGRPPPPPTSSSAGSSSNADREKRAPRFSWTPAFEATFFRSLCDSVSKGLRENHSFKSEAWNHAFAALRQEHNAYPFKSHLVNKADNARKKFRLWRGLREHPDFVYDAETHTVTASDEAWAARIAEEPLSRALRGRPFEHEEYMEVLYPDVIGTGGAPKRVMRPKRKGPDSVPGTGESDMPGTSVLDLQVDQTFTAPPVPPQPQPHQHQHASNGSSSGIAMSPARPSQHRGGQMARPPTSTTIPPRSAITSTSALTPPEESATNPRKRLMVPAPTQNFATQNSNMSASSSMFATSTVPMPTPPLTNGPSNASPSTAASLSLRPVAHGQNSTGTPVHPHNKRRRVAARMGAPTNTAPNSTPSSGPPYTADAFQSSTGPTHVTKSHPISALEETLSGLLELVRGTSPRGTRWPEEALEIFFRDFSEEDSDVQVRIAEKVLTDPSKAMVFCKMTHALRKHWVKRLRDSLFHRTTA